MESLSTLPGQVECASTEIWQVSAREQALSRRCHAHRAGCNLHGGVHDVSRAHHLFPAQSIPFHGYDLGPDVCAARTRRGQFHHPGDRARVFRRPAREVADYRIDDRRFDEPRVLSERARPGTVGSRSPAERTTRPGRWRLSFLSDVTLSKNATSSCWPTRVRDCPVIREATPEARYAISSSALEKRLSDSPRVAQSRWASNAWSPRADMKPSSRYSIGTRRIRSRPLSWCSPSLTSAPN